MSALVATERYSINAPVSAEALPVPLPQLARQISLLMNFPDFNFQLAAPIIDFGSLSKDGKVNARVAIDEDVFLILSLTGKLIEGGNKFQTEQIFLSTELVEGRPRIHFVASTLWATLYLAEEVRFQIPEIQLDLKLNFERPLLEISELLKERQTAYRLMVIERATGKRFQLPMDYSAEEMTAIIFTYRAIVDRSFVRAIEPTKQYISILATQENLAKLPADKCPIPYEFPPEPVSRVVLGEPISLGQGTMVIEDFFIQNADEVKRELAMNDGHSVECIVDSLSGQAIFNLPEAPGLPDEPWDSNIQSLIDLESQLDARLVERYHALAVATLDGLTEEEKARVTARPKLDFGAFLSDDANEEDD